MNPEEDFELKLRSLTAKLARPDPTAAWKADILSRASRAREARRTRTPRWFLATLGVAWVCIGLLWVSTPRADDLSFSSTAPSSVATSGSYHDAPDTPWKTIIALNSNPDSTDLP
jgi:hypothetical protein